MSNDMFSAIRDAIEQRAAEDADSLEAARRERVAASREANDHTYYRDPALSVPGRIDSERRKAKR